MGNQGVLLLVGAGLLICIVLCIFWFFKVLKDR